jgi:DNA mismatch endonuclease (patch repair protein)
MDRISPQHRSWNMARIRSRDTRPEQAVAAALRRTCRRFVQHSPDLPGRPDFAVPRLRLAIVVNGCFWHRHPGCVFAYTPKSRLEFWSAKFAANVRRDHRAARNLRRLGWSAATIWECRVGDEQQLKASIDRLMRIAARREKSLRSRA